MSHPRTPEATIARIRALLATGATRQEIADATGVALRTVYKHCKGLPRVGENRGRKRREGKA